MEATTAPAPHTLAPAVRDALAASGWFMCAMWRHAGEGPWHVEVQYAFDTEEEADEAYREESAGLSDAFREGHDGFLLTCPSDDARDNVPADDHERIARFQRGMLEVLVDAIG